MRDAAATPGATILFADPEEDRIMQPLQAKATSSRDNLLFGFAIGFFISLSGYGFHLIVTVLARDIAVLHSQWARHLLGMLWSLVSATVAMQTAFGRSRCNTAVSEERSKTVERDLRVVEGILIGNFVSWTTADFISGSVSSASLSFGLLLLAVTCCRVLRHVFSSSREVRLSEKRDEPIIV